MCATCGCGESDGVRVAEPGLSHDRSHDHEHGNSHDHEHRHTETVVLEQRVLAKNDELAKHNREWMQKRRISALNVMSSPGAGKTTLLVRTINDLRKKFPIAVIEGDQETQLDAERIRATGSPVVQVNTGAGCHLDAEMIDRAFAVNSPIEGSLLLIENVGNLVCPALFDLGEEGKVVLISTPEGADKPAKYPHIFAVADLVVVNKIDLLPYVDFDVEDCSRQARMLNPAVRVIALSAKTGEGLPEWYRWIHRRMMSTPVAVDN